MAEGALRAALAAAGVAAEVGSAGTHSYHLGDGADPRAVAAAQMRGVDIGEHIARQVQPADFDDCDVILACDRTHLSILERQRPAECRARVEALMSYAENPEDEVPDPYYGYLRDFEHALDLIEAASAGLAKHLQR